MCLGSITEWYTFREYSKQDLQSSECGIYKHKTFDSLLGECDCFLMLECHLSYGPRSLLVYAGRITHDGKTQTLATLLLLLLWSQFLPCFVNEIIDLPFSKSWLLRASDISYPVLVLLSTVLETVTILITNVATLAT